MGLLNLFKRDVRLKTGRVSGNKDIIKDKSGTHNENQELKVPGESRDKRLEEWEAYREKSRKELESYRNKRRESPSPKVTSVSDIYGIEKNIYTIPQNPKTEEMAFLCPIREATIKCNSPLIEKLSGLTKFIISSLYEGKTVNDIIALTSMGAQTIKDEIDYLVQGNLIEPDNNCLTPLGEEYGRLIISFSKSEEGIPSFLNTFADVFENIDKKETIERPDATFRLKENTPLALVAGRDYSNSLKIAKGKLEDTIPFRKEIEEELHTTVKLENKILYKRVFLRNYERGYISYDKCSVRVAIPFDRITLKPRYKKIDPFRSVLGSLLDIDNSKNLALLSDQGKTTLKLALEENNAETITISVNCITGQVTTYHVEFISKEEIGSARIAPTCNEFQIQLLSDKVEGIYLEEVSRKRMYRIFYYSYEKLEE